LPVNRVVTIKSPRSRRVAEEIPKRNVALLALESHRVKKKNDKRRDLQETEGKRGQVGCPASTSGTKEGRERKKKTTPEYEGKENQGFNGLGSGTRQTTTVEGGRKTTVGRKLFGGPSWRSTKGLQILLDKSGKNSESTSEDARNVSGKRFGLDRTIFKGKRRGKKDGRRTD